MIYAFSVFLMAEPAETFASCDTSQFSNPAETCFVSKGVALPYPVTWILRGFDQCRNGKHKHQAVDIGGLGKEFGLGDPVRSMVKSEVIYVGRPSVKPAQFGRPNKRAKTVIRHGRQLPASKEIKGYGKVHFFTLDYGRSRTGEFLATRAIEGDYVGHEFRYMHMGAIRSDIKVGTQLEAGEVFGLMGGTAIMKSPPHLHVDISAPDGQRLDVMPILGLKSRHKPCANAQVYHKKKKAKTPLAKAKSGTLLQSPSTKKNDASQLSSASKSASKTSSSRMTKPNSSVTKSKPLTAKSVPEKSTAKWPKKHKITMGETLSSLAQQHGLSVKAILKANKLDNPDRIWEGQVLILPKPVKRPPKKVIDSKKWRVHTIVQGDNLSGLAVRYGCSIEQLMEWNNLQNDKIYQGQKLKIAR